MPLAQNHAWSGPLPTLVSEPAPAILAALAHFVPDASEAQLHAWRTSLDTLQKQGAVALAAYPPAQEHSAVLEYELPREAGRRPDVVVLQNGAVVVLEFKETGLLRRADLDQVQAYARDLAGYHEACHDLLVHPLLVLCGSGATERKVDGVHVVPPSRLAEVLVEISRASDGKPIDLEKWLAAEYAPLPTLVAAARLLFERQPLPFIRRAQSAGVGASVERVLALARDAAEQRSRVLVLLTGVPGAGKTLVGLQVAHSAELDVAAVQREGKGGASAVYLSGNGPLVQVLQHALGGGRAVKTFVQDMHAYIRHYGLQRPDAVPPEHLVVFDEAQRAWDADKVLAHHGKRRELTAEEREALHRSEPTLLIDAAERIPGWSMVLALVGGGQEIHSGEEAGMAQWAEALARSPHKDAWRVVGPPFLQGVFEAAGLPYAWDERLNLNATLRSHAAADLHRWVELLLDEGAPGLDQAARLAERLKLAGFPIYVTRDLEAAKAYARDRFAGESRRRFGLLASSRARNLQPYGVDPSWQATRFLRVANWFNDEPESRWSCCQLGEAITEFQAQGLEVDLPIVCWGDDFYWADEQWHMRVGRQQMVRDPFRLRTNAYRVLLTRGREALVIFVPDAPAARMDGVFEALTRAGAIPVAASAAARQAAG